MRRAPRRQRPLGIFATAGPGGAKSLLALACRAVLNLRGDRGGTSAVEFALIAPLLLLLAVGTVQFGLTLNNYILLTEAVRTGSRQFAVSRGSSVKPYTDSINSMHRSAPTLDRASLTIAIQVNGASCSGDTACTSALAAAQGQPATVAASYPCKLVVMGYDFAPGCTLASSTTERIE